MFQKIPHRERMRHIQYRAEQWNRDEERHEKEVIRKMIAEKEAALSRDGQSHVTDKDRDVMEAFERLRQIMGD